MYNKNDIMINWKNIYNNLVEKNKHANLVEGMYYEKHHIIPRYMGGDNSNQNLVHLSFREHILAHYILWRMYGNIEDQIAYKMMNGQTEEGRILKQKLAVKRSNESNKAEIVKAIFKDEEKVKDIIKKRKHTRYANNNGKWYSDESASIMSRKAKENYDKIHTKEAGKKRSEAMKQNAQNMSDDEFHDRYVKHMEGPLHPMYGKKRPGELAGNHGKSKGEYILITPDGEQIHFSGIRKLMSFGFSETLARKWANNGIIQLSPQNKKPFRWAGYELRFILNETYGDINKQQESRKRFN